VNGATHAKQAGALVTTMHSVVNGGRSADGNSENCRSKIIVWGWG